MAFWLVVLVGARVLIWCFGRVIAVVVVCFWFNAL